MPNEVDVAIVGGGIMGLSTAYHLARQSYLRIAVIEASYLAAGASGRNGGGVRMQWSDPDNVELMMESLRICRGLTQELGINTWFRQGGYLFLARTEAQAEQLEANAVMHRSLGAPTRLVSADAARDIVPELDTSGVVVASFNPMDAVVFPWPFLWGYAARATAMGVAVRTHTPVERIEPATATYHLHLASGERLEADTVVMATGAYGHRLNRTLGIELPNRPHRHEILSTAPLKPFFDPLVVDLSTGLYASQSTRGEVVAGVTMGAPDFHARADEIDLSSSLAFLERIGRALTRVFPRLGGVSVLRQWAGPYDFSPDGDPIVGPSPGHPKVIQMCGFTGHGFMMGPAVGRIVARYIATGESHRLLERWSPSRFADGGVRKRREVMIIG
ncbi:MAG: FAD-binding oxidoreductase [Deltaproteobacteria bacterium]|nr:MAG: FAD-binding oxidoreductase [Deltaproteobacteria bacterium]